MTKRQRLQLVNNAHKAFKMPFVIFDAEQGDGPGAPRFYIQTYGDAQTFIDFARNANWVARDAHVCEHCKSCSECCDCDEEEDE